MKDSIGSLPFDTKIICKTGGNASELLELDIKGGHKALVVAVSKTRIT